VSIRARLTLWYAALLAVLLVAFDVAVYLALSRNLYLSADRTITARAQEVSNAISQVLAARADPASYLLRERVVLPDIDVFASPEMYVQVLTAGGQLVAKSENLGDQFLPLSNATLDQVLEGGESLLETTLARQSPLRQISAPIWFGQQVVGVAQVGRSLQDIEDTLRQLRNLLLAGSLAGLAVATGVGSLLARRALHPIDDITRTANSIIEAQDLGRRLDHRGSPDEVGRLVSTFNRMLARIEGLFRSQQSFIADVSHELRSPLTAVTGHLDLLAREECAGTQRRDILATARGETERMARLVADLLLLAQADAGVRLGAEPVELDTLLLEVYRQSKPLAQGVQLRLGQEDQALVTGDPDRLKQLLLNLVDNALKYTPEGGTVTLDLERVSDAAGEWARVTVTDTGIGIPAEELPRIFERFYRVDKARSRAQGGTGLGLSIAQWIAEAHGGRITVTSEVGQGSAFTLWLPMGGAHHRGTEGAEKR